MLRRFRPIPKFANEAEERKFRDSHDSISYVDWSRARAVAFPKLRPSTKTTSLRLPEDVLNAIRAHARKLDVPYQSLMKLWRVEKAAQTTQLAAPSPKLGKARWHRADSLSAASFVALTLRSADALAWCWLPRTTRAAC
jgi:predicted DNA binding CopG/RHH family protein